VQKTNVTDVVYEEGKNEVLRFKENLGNFEWKGFIRGIFQKR